MHYSIYLFYLFLVRFDLHYPINHHPWIDLQHCCSIYHSVLSDQWQPLSQMLNPICHPNLQMSYFDFQNQTMMTRNCLVVEILTYYLKRYKMHFKSFHNFFFIFLFQEIIKQELTKEQCTLSLSREYQC